jgi:uncharacterized protein
VSSDAPHLPYAAEIEAYGRGGFSFAGMSHRGSILCLPDGIWASPITRFEDINEAALAPVFAQAGVVTHCLIGAGARSAILPADLRRKFAESKIAVECMATGAAISTYNILMGEQRPVAALLIAIA